MKLAIILGGSAGVQDDYRAARQLVGDRPFETMCVNDIGIAWPHVDHWISIHAEKFQGWRDQRRDLRLPRALQHWTTPDHVPNLPWAKTEHWAFDSDFAVPCGQHGSGSSGLYACKIALKTGHDRVILCGVPMHPEGAHFFDPTPWMECDGFRPAWEYAKPWLAESVRSLAGWTRDMLGAPTEEWLA